MNEGEAIYVTLTANPPPAHDISVKVKSTQHYGRGFVRSREFLNFTMYAGQASASFVYDTKDDNTYDDWFIFSLQSGDGYRLGNSRPLEVTVLDSEEYIYLVGVETVNDYITEGGLVSYVVEAKSKLNHDLTINYTYTISTADRHNSYQNDIILPKVSGRAVFNILTPDNTLTSDDGDQYIELTLDQGAHYRWDKGDGYAYTVIADDEGEASFVAQTSAEASEGDTLNVSVYLSRPLATNASIAYATRDGDAKAGSDYVAQNGTLTFAPGETKKTIAIQTLDNSFVDFSRDLSLAFSDGVGGRLPARAHRYQIVDNEVAVVGIHPTTDGHSANTIGIQITTTIPFKHAQKVPYYVLAGSLAAVDVHAFTLEAGVTSQNFTLWKGDGQHEIPRNTVASIYLLEDAGYGYIVGGHNSVVFDTDDPPVISIEAGDTPVYEPALARFYLLADPPPKDDLRVRVAIANPDDLRDVPLRLSFTIPYGKARQAIDIQTIDFDSNDQPLVVEVVDGDGYTLADARQAEVMVVDDDVALRMTLEAAQSAVLEGEDADFIVRLSSPSARNLTLVYYHGVDYDDNPYATPARATIPAGSANITISVPTYDDNITASNSYDNATSVGRSVYIFGFIDEASAPEQYASTHVIEDDAGAAFSLQDYATIAEGSSRNISVYLSEALPESASVDYVTRDDTAIAGEDYVATHGTLTFAPGEVKKSFTLTTIDNNQIDGGREFDILISNATSNNTIGVTISRGLGRFRITDNDRLTLRLEALPRQHQSDNYSFRVVASHTATKNKTIRYLLRRGGTLNPLVRDSVTLPAGNRTAIITIAQHQLATADPTANTPNQLATAPANYTLVLRQSGVYALATPSHLPLATTPLPVASLTGAMVLADNATNATTATAHFTIRLDPPADRDLVIGIGFAGAGLANTTDLPETITMPQGESETQFALAMNPRANATTVIAQLLAGEGYWLGEAEVSLHLPASQVVETDRPIPVASLMADMVMAEDNKSGTAYFTMGLAPPAEADLAIGISFAGDGLNNTLNTTLNTTPNALQSQSPVVMHMAPGATEAEFVLVMNASANATTLVAELLAGEGYVLGEEAVVRLQMAAAPEETKVETQVDKPEEEDLLDPANRIILPKTALVFADSVASAIRGRITSAFANWGRATPTRVQVDGQTPQQFATRQAQQQATRNPWDTPQNQASSIDPTQLNFATALNTGNDSPNRGAALWGEGFSRSLSVKDGNFSSDGDVRGGVLGVDLVADDKLVVGIGVGLNSAAFAFSDGTQPDTQANIKGNHTSESVTVHPYFGWQNEAGTRLWGNAGFGEGDVVAVISDDSDGSDVSNQQQTQSYTSVFDMRSLGLGGSVAIGDQSRRGDDAGAMQFNLIGEGVVAEVKDATWRDWVRHGLVRLGIEWRQSATDDKGNIGTSGLQIAARHDFADGDAGDAGEDSTGVEFTGDVEKHMPEFGLTLDLQARVFVTDDSNYDEWGVAGGVAWSASPPKQPGQPNPPHRQGLSLALRPQWGDTKSQSDTLLQHGSGALGSHATGKPAGYDYDVRYGVPILGGKHALTHFARGNDRDQTTIGSEVSIGRLRAVLEQEARGNHAFIRYEGKF
ncbi:MAG: hypothetical protein MJE68_31800 [Proteobacteria bacterium]|nr:hypothetical protein [Pseudomonadota bacterium]